MTIKINSVINKEINQKQMKYLCFLSVLKENFEKMNQLQKTFLFFKMSHFLDLQLSNLQCQKLHDDFIRQHKSIDNIIQFFSKKLLITSQQIQHYHKISVELSQLIIAKMQFTIEFYPKTKKNLQVQSKKFKISPKTIIDQNQQQFNQFKGSKGLKYVINQSKQKQVSNQIIANYQFLQNKLGKLELKIIDNNNRLKQSNFSNVQNEQKHINSQNQIFYEYQQYKKPLNFQESKTQYEGQLSQHKKQFKLINKSNIIIQQNIYRAISQSQNHQLSFNEYELSPHFRGKDKKIKQNPFKDRAIWTKEEHLRYSIFLKQFKKQLIPRQTNRPYIFRKMSLYLNLTKDNDQCNSHHAVLYQKHGSIENILKSFQTMINENFDKVYIDQLTFELHSLAKSEKFSSFYLYNLKYEENLKKQGKQDEEDILVKKQILNRLQNKQTRQNLTSQQKQLINAGNKNGWSFFQNVMFYIGILRNIHTLRCKHKNYRIGIVKDIQNCISTQKTSRQCQDKLTNLRKKTPITEVEILKILQTKYKLTKDEVQEIMQTKQGYFEILQKKIRLLLEKDQSNKQIPQRQI